MHRTALCCFAAVVLCAASTVSAKERRNLLIIQTDEHHFGTLGCYGGAMFGGEESLTPTLDRLAGQGAIATSFYATSPVCSPSRAAFCSGLYPQATPVITNNIPMDVNVQTFADVLARQGYSTGYAGKWHLDGAGKPQWGPRRKFGFEDNRFMFNRGHWKKFGFDHDGPQVAARNNRGQPSYSVDDADAQTFSTDWLTDRAIDFIEENADEPFCYWLSIPDPHGPNTVRAPYDTMYSAEQTVIPASLTRSAAQTPAWGTPSKGVTERSLRRIMPDYFGMVKCIDDNVARIIETLKQRQLLERTIVVFTSDHGDLCGEHGRLNKGVPYEGSARIPFIVRAEGLVPPGIVVPEALSCVDFLPTMISLLDVKPTGSVHGRDASGLFTTRQTVGEWNDIAFLRNSGMKPVWLTAVSDRHKLVFSMNDQPWLFDLEKDAQELVNRFDDADYAPVVRRLSNALLNYCDKYRDPNGQHPKLRADMKSAAAE